VFKEQTLINGRINSGGKFEDIMSADFMAEKKRDV
jgi:hypothetical protein